MGYCSAGDLIWDATALLDNQAGAKGGTPGVA